MHQESDEEESTLPIYLKVISLPVLGLYILMNFNMTFYHILTMINQKVSKRNDTLEKWKKILFYLDLFVIFSLFS